MRAFIKFKLLIAIFIPVSVYGNPALMLEAAEFGNSTVLAKIIYISSEKPNLVIKSIQPNKVKNAGYFHVKVRVIEWLHHFSFSSNVNMQLPNLPHKDIDLLINTDSESPEVWIGPKVGETHIFIFSENNSLLLGTTENVCLGRMEPSYRDKVVEKTADMIVRRAKYSKEWLEWKAGE